MAVVLPYCKVVLWLQERREVCGQGSTGTLKEATARLSCRLLERREVLDTAAAPGGRKEGARRSTLSLFFYSSLFHCLSSTPL